MRFTLLGFTLFKKKSVQPEPRVRFEQDPSLTEELTRRVNAIDFQPSKGFLKNQSQPKRPPKRVYVVK